MGPGMVLRLGTGIALPDTLPVPTRPPLPRVHPSPHYPSTPVPTCRSLLAEGPVGLKSVAQLTLSVQFSGSGTITEVYNLLSAGNPNDHFTIPGTK